MASSLEPQKAFAEKLRHECSDLLKLALTASDRGLLSFVEDHGFERP